MQLTTGTFGTFQDWQPSRLMFSLDLRSGLIVHWSGYVAVGCMWWRKLHSSSLYSTVAHHSVGRSCRVIQLGESEMPFVSLGTLLVHDKTLLAVLSEVDTVLQMSQVAIEMFLDLDRPYVSHTLVDTKTLESRMPLRA